MDGLNAYNNYSSIINSFIAPYVNSQISSTYRLLGSTRLGAYDGSFTMNTSQTPKSRWAPDSKAWDYWKRRTQLLLGGEG